MGSHVRSVAGLVAAAVVLTGTLAGCGDDEPGASGTPSATPNSASSGSSASSASSAEPVTLTFGVYGKSPVVRAYSAAAKAYHQVDPSVTIKIKSWPDEYSMTSSLTGSGEAPDVFLTPRADVSRLSAAGVVQPVDTYLEARNIDLGDSYSRAAVNDFSLDKHLVCMPYAVSPDVLYVNTDLVDFDAMRKRGLDVPDAPETGTWDLDDFAAAMKFATRPRKHIAGMYAAPNLRGLAPWLTAAGGSLVDDPKNPTRLALEDSTDAIKALWPTVLNQRFRLSATQLKQATPLRWFERGQLAVLPGDRSLVPHLRGVPGLHWNVMAIPSTGDPATVGDYSGLCLSEQTEDPDVAADFLAYLVSAKAVAEVARTGYVVPVNQQVAYADAFVQPNRAPANAAVFTSAIKGMTAIPAPHTFDQLQIVAGPQISKLLHPGIDVESVTQTIDDLSTNVLRPVTPSASPTG